ncbi:insulinase family protein [Hazenella sp. IB182353]|uniref:EF-P 5-aminopentanol modification-associated protein YfmF n=1 Tax=Polycladospora coralii TaxID=2771432 RepID=UPI00174711BA|nr:pitrilysin family protein [Polycladospora coralii]MBS7530831.1 insulinase family protein [Polycladospora coralii]
MTSPNFKTIEMGSIRAHVLTTNQFKSTTFSCFIQQPLQSEFVTKTALLPAILQRGTKQYQTTTQLQQALDHMYGAILFGDVFKRGERHIIQMGMEVANEQYLKESASLLEEGLHFFSQVLLNPITENEHFHLGYLKSEKKNLQQKIESFKDDKMRLASQRLLESMYKDQPFALFNHGRTSDLDQISAEGLYTYYQDVIRNRPIDFYCIGDIDVQEFTEIMGNHFSQLMDHERKLPQRTTEKAEVEKVREVVERYDVKQGKLNLGLRTYTTYQDDDYPALMLYNGILGGFAHSKLFMNVREKESLAYYCSSRIDSHQGFLGIQSGIEIENYSKALGIIKEQLFAMENGDISERELIQTKATLSNQLRESQDRAYDLMNAHYHGVLSNKERSISQLLTHIEEVTLEDVKRVAQKIKLDTIYFLRDKGGANHGEN